MSSDELSRLINDVMSNPAMVAEAATITEQPAMEAYIRGKGYDLTQEEMNEVWAMASNVMVGNIQPMTMAGL